MTTTEVPTIIPQEVTDYVAGLGLKTVFDEILEKLPEMFPEVLRIVCEVDPGIEDESDPMVVIGVGLPDHGPTYPTLHMRWADWAVRRFPGRLLYHFTVIHWYEPIAHEGP